MRARAVFVVVVLLLVAAASAGCEADLAGRAGPDQRVAAERAATARPVAGKVLATIGVVSENAARWLPARKTMADWRRIARNPAVDLIGWQESKSPGWRAAYPQFRDQGWQTWFWPNPDTGPISLAVSWRTSVFELLDVDTRRMHKGGYPSETSHPFPARWVVVAQLRHRATGRTVRLLNTHVNHHIETGDGWQDNLNARRARTHLRKLAGMWASMPGDVVVGTGDYNFDYADDVTARPDGGISRRFAGRAVSSYDVLGTDGVVPTRRSRWIDYVFLSSDSIRDDGGRGGLAQFATHRSLAGFHSDHRPMLARIRLYR